VSRRYYSVYNIQWHRTHISCEANKRSLPFLNGRFSKSRDGINISDFTSQKIRIRRHRYNIHYIMDKLIYTTVHDVELYNTLQVNRESRCINTIICATVHYIIAYFVLCSSSVVNCYTHWLPLFHRLYCRRRNRISSLSVYRLMDYNIYYSIYYLFNLWTLSGFLFTHQDMTVNLTLTNAYQIRAKITELVWISPMDSRANVLPATLVSWWHFNLFYTNRIV